MDELAVRLRRDAEAIDVEAPAELRARIDRGITPVPRPRAARPAERAPAALTWASVAAGLAAVLLLVIVRDPVPTPAPEPVAATPRNATLLPLPTALDVRTADFTRPLDDELAALQADIERARETIEAELRDTL